MSDDQRLLLPFAKDHTDLRAALRCFSLVADPPHRRDRPEEDDLPGRHDFRFDGGACRFDTGVTAYTFADGTEAWTPVRAPVAWFVRLPNGRVVTLGFA